MRDVVRGMRDVVRGDVVRGMRDVVRGLRDVVRDNNAQSKTAAKISGGYVHQKRRNCIHYISDIQSLKKDTVQGCVYIIGKEEHTVSDSCAVILGKVTD